MKKLITLFIMLLGVSVLVGDDNPVVKDVNISASNVMYYSTMLTQNINAATLNIRLYIHTGNSYYLQKAKEYIRQAMYCNERFYEETSDFLQSALKLLESVQKHDK